MESSFKAQPDTCVETRRPTHISTKLVAVSDPNFIVLVISFDSGSLFGFHISHNFLLDQHPLDSTNSFG